MPHISIKCYPGRSEQQKKHLTEKITKDICEIFHASENNVSIAIQEIQPENWYKEVVDKEISPQKDFLYKFPDYKL